MLLFMLFYRFVSYFFRGKFEVRFVRNLREYFVPDQLPRHSVYSRCRFVSYISREMFEVRFVHNLRKYLILVQII